jgi:hypothetical protein
MLMRAKVRCKTNFFDAVAGNVSSVLTQVSNKDKH